MEMVGGFVDEEWESLSKMFSGGECDGATLFPATGEFPFMPFSDTNFCSISQESSNTGEIERSLFSEEDQQQFVDDHNASFGSMSFYNNGGNLMMMPVFSDDAMEEILNSKDAETADSCMEIKRKYHDDDKSQNFSPEISPNKIQRVTRNAGKKGQKKKKIQEKNNEEESKSSCSSEDDSNAASQEIINGDQTSKSKGKAKSNRGSATDPQSLYARKRRERINERLKILQNLVPNGTKVDISTMLEEAVQYVKFLQLQIKLLSSDDLWMYAPLAYNGMDIGMYQKISPNLRLHIN